MPLVLIQLLASLGFLLSRLAELRIHGRNAPRLRRAGAVEGARTWSNVYVALSWLIMPLAWLERAWLGFGAAAAWHVIAGMSLLAVALALRAWSITSLGPFWSWRCLWLEGVRPLNLGPYRYLDHPEYLSRYLDVLGVSLLMAAPLTGVGSLLLITFAIVRLAAEESSQIRGMPGAPETVDPASRVG